MCPRIMSSAIQGVRRTDGALQPSASRLPEIGFLSPSLSMGIRFHCPSGHKLNVKAFLAGKRAICPKCGAKVVVPLTSESEDVFGDEGKAVAGSAILQASTSAIGSTVRPDAIAGTPS